jgi:hypothetical protein
MAPSGGVVMDLDPSVRAILIKETGRKRKGPTVDPNVSKKAKFVYPMAVQIIGEQNVGWVEALRLAEQCWADGGDAIPEQDLDDQALMLGHAVGQVEVIHRDAEGVANASSDEEPAWADVAAPDGDYDLVGADE